jgi:hypothetical protein
MKEPHTCHVHHYDYSLSAHGVISFHWAAFQAAAKKIPAHLNYPFKWAGIPYSIHKWRCLYRQHCRYVIQAGLLTFGSFSGAPSRLFPASGMMTAFVPDYSGGLRPRFSRGSLSSRLHRHLKSFVLIYHPGLKVKQFLMQGILSYLFS